MYIPFRIFLAFSLIVGGSACGIVPPAMTEVWDNGKDATYNMEVQVRKAIFCELRSAVIFVQGGKAVNTYLGRDVTTDEDQPLPNTWGAQVTTTFQVDEKAILSPGISLTKPLEQAQSFSLGLGGTLSSSSSRYHKFYTFYSISELGTLYSNDEPCKKTNIELGIGPQSTSTPLVEGNLGIYDWLSVAAFSNNYLKSSRAARNGEGSALTSGSFGADVISHDIKFVIRSEGNISPIWKLIRVTASTTQLFDAFRERTHEVQITIGPGSATVTKGSKGRPIVTVSGPSDGAAALHQAGQIGTAVANSLRQ